MSTTKKIALVIAICIGAGSVSLAKDSGPPTIDIQKMCEETSSALGASYGSDVKASIAACLADEKMRKWRVSSLSRTGQLIRRSPGSGACNRENICQAMSSGWLASIRHETR